MTRCDYCVLRRDMNELWDALLADQKPLHAYETATLLGLITLIQRELELRAEGQYDDHCN